jgi:hypothetical protein
VLDPDDRHPLQARPLDEAPDVRDDRVALVGPFEDAVLRVDDEERRVRPVRERGHRSTLSRTPAGRPAGAG